MFEWFFNRKKKAPGQPGQFSRQFRRAQRLIAQRNAGQIEGPAKSAEAAVAAAPAAVEILPLAGPEQPAVEYTPATVSEEARLASSLETVLQGNRVAPEVFTELYRGGYVFKEPAGKWAITQPGKDLIERHKLYVPDMCLVDGVRCHADWSRRS